MSTALAEISPLILSGEGYGLQVSPDAEAQKAELIRHSALIVEVSDNTAAEAARLQLGKLAALRILTEKSRTKVKEPVLTIGKKIDAIAKAFVGEIEAEEKRVSGLIGAHAQKVEAERQAELRRQQEAERARIAEEQRLAAEAEAAALAAKKAEEAALFSDDEEDAKKAQTDAQAAEAARQKLAAEQAEAARAAVDELAVTFGRPVVEQVQGVKFEPDFVVEDAAKLYAAFPDLVELTVKRAPTLTRIKAWMETHNGDLPTVPGLAITKKAVVSKR